MALQSSLSRKKAASQKPRYQNVLLVDFCVKPEDIHRQEAWHQTRLQKSFTIKHLSSDTTRLAWAGKKSSSREISFSIGNMIRWSPFLKEGIPSEEGGLLKSKFPLPSGAMPIRRPYLEAKSAQGSKLSSRLNEWSEKSSRVTLFWFGE